MTETANCSECGEEIYRCHIEPDTFHHIDPTRWDHDARPRSCVGHGWFDPSCQLCGEAAANG